MAARDARAQTNTDELEFTDSERAVAIIKPTIIAKVVSVNGALAGATTENKL